MSNTWKWTIRTPVPRNLREAVNTPSLRGSTEHTEHERMSHMEEFVGKNGHTFGEVSSSSLGRVVAAHKNNLHYAGEISLGAFQDLEEYFLSKYELWKASNGLLVLRTNKELLRHKLEQYGRMVFVLMPEGVTPAWEHNHDLHDLSDFPEAAEAAKEYFETFPRGTWVNAQEGEVWDVTFGLPDSVSKRKFRSVVVSGKFCGEHNIEIRSECIIDAEKILDADEVCV